VVALATGGAAERIDLGAHERLGHLLDHGPQEVDVALRESSAARRLRADGGLDFAA